ncbi:MULTISPECIES: hypothetical protein [unclassified Streptomyces]|uniref:hypothetical protein n=1 Tax=unclassified Streptomyces TaxID=2593676 RepID=UPI000DC76F33|nr:MULTISPECIES: hypothetical protein [unclassified Streptomyces]AWZ07415.1 hypothetical protein DRB89_25605 [Streptomyces sp. ICC4]AWZ12657.1 hypothetical protein DRB96_10345 [Streptomyces sp. ICC1]
MSDEKTSKEIATITRVETVAERTGAVGIGELADLAPAAAAALNLLADAIKRGTADQDAVVEALKAAKVDEAFAAVLTAAAHAVMDAAEDPYDFDDRLVADNLSGAASDVRRAFHWL